MKRLAVLLVLTTGAVLAPASAASADGAAVASPVASFTRLGQWPAGYVGSITIRNDSAAVVDGWRVEFDLPGTRVASSYSGVFTRSGEHYTVTNETWNAKLPPGSSTTFGWVASGQGDPANCTLNGAGCAGTAADHTAPSRPGPLAFDISSGLTITWAASTDDQGPVKYEVYESGEPRATVTDTRYVYSTGGTLPPRVYVFSVRAVDAAGNVSPWAFKSLGQIWRGDEIPAPPSAPRVDTPAAGLVRLSWTAPPAQSPFVTAPVAGYEVLLDGVPVGQVGSTSIVIAAPPPGPHTLGVRTLNAVDNYSPVVEVSYP